MPQQFLDGSDVITSPNKVLFSTLHVLIIITLANDSLLGDSIWHAANFKIGQVSLK
jgi:hypothetical protein